MDKASLNQLCDQGQSELTNTQYLDAAATFATAENIAWTNRDFDTLSRLYLPLQEARRQIRQRCGEGAIRMRQPVQLQAVKEGFVLVTNSADLQFIKNQNTYIEPFLAAIFPDEQGNPLTILLPILDTPLPPPTPRPAAQLQSLLPLGCLVLRPDELPADTAHGSADTFARIMSLWERLHTPFLQAAERETDPIKKMQAFRDTLKVDPACELAHQHLANTARTLRHATKPW